MGGIEPAAGAVTLSILIVCGGVVSLVESQTPPAAAQAGITHRLLPRFLESSMKCMIFPTLAFVLTASLAFCRGETQGQSRPDFLFDDFESGTFDKWTVEGAAFGKGPLEYVGLNSPLPIALADANWEKLYCPGRQGKYVAHSAPHNNSGPQGKLTSRPITIERRGLRKRTWRFSRRS